jgi:hypothetical protein
MPTHTASRKRPTTRRSKSIGFSSSPPSPGSKNPLWSPLCKLVMSRTFSLNTGPLLECGSLLPLSTSLQVPSRQLAAVVSRWAARETDSSTNPGASKLADGNLPREKAAASCRTPKVALLTPCVQKKLLVAFRTLTEKPDQQQDRSDSDHPTGPTRLPSLCDRRRCRLPVFLQTSKFWDRKQRVVLLSG